MNLDAKIKAIELKTVALAKVQSELQDELEEVKKLKTKPARPVRRNLKVQRVQEVANFYMKRKLKKAI